MTEFMRDCKKILGWAHQHAPMYGMDTSVIYAFPPGLRGTNAELVLRVAAQGKMLLTAPDETTGSVGFTDAHIDAICTGYCMFERMTADTPYTQHIHNDLEAMRNGLIHVAYHYNSWMVQALEIQDTAAIQIGATLDQLLEGLMTHDAKMILRLYLDDLKLTPDRSGNIADIPVRPSLTSTAEIAFQMRQPKDLEDLFEMMGRPTDLIQAEACVIRRDLFQQAAAMINATGQLLAKLDGAMTFGPAQVVGLPDRRP